LFAGGELGFDGFGEEVSGGAFPASDVAERGDPCGLQAVLAGGEVFEFSAGDLVAAGFAEKAFGVGGELDAGGKVCGIHAEDRLGVFLKEAVDGVGTGANLGCGGDQEDDDPALFPVGDGLQCVSDFDADRLRGRHGHGRAAHHNGQQTPNRGAKPFYHGDSLAELSGILMGLCCFDFLAPRVP